MVIKSIRLENFRQFEDFRISCRSMNVLVGPNNSGKSTSLDAMRFLVDVIRYSRTQRPNLTTSPDGSVCLGYEIAHNHFGPPILNANRNYDENDAKIAIEHANGAKLTLLLHPERSVRVYLEADRMPARTGVGFRKAFPVDIVVVPTLGPLDEKESWVTDGTVQRNRYTRLANRSFRNILNRMDNNEFGEFASLVQTSWPSIRLSKPAMTDYMNKELTMLYEEDRIPREIYWSGFGLQVWMQIIYQLMRGRESSILVIDEPDIYLHPELQKELVRLIQKRFTQIFLATHSTEIVNEVEPGGIVLVARNSRSARRISTEDGYRELLNYIGSSENAEFARIARAKRIVFFEGKDRRLIRRFAEKIDDTHLIESSDTAFFQSGGFTQWSRILNVDWTLENMFRIDANIVAIFDRDYLCDAEADEFLARMNSDRIRTFVLDRKEIENYAIEYAPLCRAIMKRVASRGLEIGEEGALSRVETVIEGMKGVVQARRLAQYLSFQKERSPALSDVTHLEEAASEFERRWRDPSDRTRMIPGKIFFSELSKNLQASFGVGITINQVIAEMRKGEISGVIAEILRDANQFFVQRGV